MGWQILTGDCVEEMAKLEECSVDAVVCDPPYGIGLMGHEWDQPGAPATKRNGRPSTLRKGPMGEPQPISQGSMEAGRYDFSLTANRRYQGWCEAWAREALRVLKPGGHLLASCGSRTYQRMACGIEDAGFEIRDSIMWLYGSGFPKSLDVSKAIDKAAGAERKVIGTKLGLPGYSLADDAGPGGVAMEGNLDGSLRNAEAECAITAPATAEAAEWDGWGTALKPAHEPIVVARKPLVGTVAANVLEHGTGAINVDACRIETSDDLNGGTYTGAKRETGRWPANAVFSHTEDCVEVGAKKVKGSGSVTGQESSAKTSGVLGEFDGRAPFEAYADEDGTETVTAWECAPGCPVAALDTQSGASRFFYCSKTSRAERNAGLEGFELKALNWSNGEENPGSFQGEGTDRSAANHHPTVKPISLMRWLARLVTPPGGRVLDPFTGSGSTGCAAVLEGFDFLGIEREPEYVVIARARIAFWAQYEGREVEEVLGLVNRSKAAAKKHDDIGQGSLLEPTTSSVGEVGS